jgi:hypothetical protein
VPPTIPFNYDGAEAQRVKQLHRSVFQVLARFVLFGEFKKKLSPDLWGADTPLQGPKQFGVRVYRAPNGPPGAHFMKRRPPNTM